MLVPTSVGRLVDPSRKPHARSRQCHRAESIEKARQVVDLAGFSMVGVARIELATPAMSRQRAVVIFPFEISLIDILFGALARNLPNSPTAEFPLGFCSILDDCLKTSDS